MGPSVWCFQTDSREAVVKRAFDLLEMSLVTLSSLRFPFEDGKGREEGGFIPCRDHCPYPRGVRTNSCHPLSTRAAAAAAAALTAFVAETARREKTRSYCYKSSEALERRRALSRKSFDRSRQPETGMQRFCRSAEDD